MPDNGAHNHLRRRGATRRSDVLEGRLRRQPRRPRPPRRGRRRLLRLRPDVPRRPDGSQVSTGRPRRSRSVMPPRQRGPVPSAADSYTQPTNGLVSAPADPELGFLRHPPPAVRCFIVGSDQLDAFDGSRHEGCAVSAAQKHGRRRAGLDESANFDNGLGRSVVSQRGLDGRTLRVRVHH